MIRKTRSEKKWQAKCVQREKERKSKRDVRRTSEFAGSFSDRGESSVDPLLGDDESLGDLLELSLLQNQDVELLEDGITVGDGILLQETFFFLLSQYGCDEGKEKEEGRTVMSLEVGETVVDFLETVILEGLKEGDTTDPK